MDSEDPAKMRKSDRASLAEDLRRLGVAPGQIVMTHASVRSVGPVHGGPDEIHLAIEDAASPGGTVMMIASCQDGVDDVGRGIHTPEEEREILARQPAFEPATARASRDNGTLVEFFRSYPGAVVSASPGGRIVARGAQAAWICADQPWDYFFGRGSPLEKLCDAFGKVLLLGCDHDTVTLLHYAEHVGDFSGKRVVRVQVPVMRDGRRVWLPCEEFDTSDRGAHPNWPVRFFAVIVDAFIARAHGTPDCTHGRVGRADSYLLDAAALVEHAIGVMKARADAPTCGRRSTS